MTRPSVVLPRLVLALLAGALAAGSADPKMPLTPAMPANVAVPPAPVRSPQDQLATFTVAPGFAVELVAADPLVHEPVAIAFDPDGRLWVVEMRGFMHDTEGKGELEKIGSVAVLSDEDGDGRMDKRVEFLSGLVMPRALCLVRGGALVAAPPALLFCRDTDGDGVADERTQVAKYAGLGNPEHTSNGLVPGLDNRIYSANHGTCLRWNGSAWSEEPAAGRGQWGLGHDQAGRFFYNSNSVPSQADALPCWMPPAVAKAAGGGGRIGSGTVWPTRPNPGINRGYLKGMLKADGSLAKVTAACGTTVYRGDLFPAEFRDNVFFCEPAGNLVQRLVVSWNGLQAKGDNPYKDSEFLTSTDERFRPVNCANGPDGALYVVDLYRGILQHRVYLTPYLRAQIAARGLDQGIGHGRIWRVVPTGAKRGERPRLGQATPAQLAQALNSANGWTRDTAQRLLVERSDKSALAEVRALVAKGATPAVRLQALWTLDGLGGADQATLASALADADAGVRGAAAWLAARLPALAAQVIALTKDPAPLAQAQAAAALGRMPGADAAAALKALAASADKRLAAVAAAAADPGRAGAPAPAPEAPKEGDQP